MIDDLASETLPSSEVRSGLARNAFHLVVGQVATTSGLTSLWGALLVLAMLPSFLAQAFGCVFRGRERMDLDALLSILNKALILVLTVGALRAGLGLPGIIGALGLAGIGQVASAAFLARRIQIVPTRGTWKTAREILVDGTPIVAMTITVAAEGYIAALVLARMAPDTVMGWYGAARNLIGTLIAPATIVGAAAFPRLSRFAHLPLEFRRELHAALRPLLGLGVLAGVGTYLFADFAVTLIYGSRGFGPAGTTLQWFAPGFFLLFVDVLLGGAIASLGRAKVLAVVKVANVATTTALDILLIPYFQAHYGNGGIGVVTSFALGETMMFVGAALILPRGSIGFPMLLDVGRALLAGVCTLALFRVLPPWPDPVRFPLCIIVFGPLAGAVGLVRHSEIVSWRYALLRRLRSHN